MNLPSGLGAALERLAERGGPLDATDRRDALTLLVDAGFDRLPLPGDGTLTRWQVLAAVAACDLGLVKLYEGHTDALAILKEVEPSFEPHRRSRWGMWAAEAAHARVGFTTTSGSTEVRLDGGKAWCSGAAAVTHGLLTAWRGEGRDDGPYLVAVAMNQPGVHVTGDGWPAVGMAASASVDVRFDGAVGRLMGGRRAYLDRPGFWQGGCGVAACWHGGAAAIGEALRRSVVQAGPDADPHRLAALGAVDMALSRNAVLLRDAAGWIDAHPHDDAMALALRVRAAAEDTATTVTHHVGRALGAAPFCRDAHFARLVADLPVFVRQSHAERDLAALGAAMASSAASPMSSKEASWAL